ncbi:MAG: hypothetical protein ACUZ8H_15975 [Candidatus Anammoxibacter sp.]
MDDMEKIYEDKTAWVYFVGHDDRETVGVYRRCVECAKYVTKGVLKMSMDGAIKLKRYGR